MAQPNVDIAKLCETVELSAQSGVPYISGTFHLDQNELAVFYRSHNGTTGHVNFASATDSDLKALADACQPASFGLGGVDVLDEAYRKAGKMDSVDYAAQVSPVNHGVLEFIRQDLFNAQNCPDIRLQMYKLNVYGPGSFFKSHVDTPRGADMFGSLVIVLPTKHEGGSLIFRHAGEEWIIDTANAVSSSAVLASPGHAAFAAFFSDVEHEVTPVTSGYRVTLTYLLYFSGSRHSNRIQPQSSAQQELHHNLSTLLDVPTFLPAGGYLGFKLVHKYSLSDDEDPDLKDLRRALKGPDARLLNVSEALGLTASLRLFYKVDEDEKQIYVSKNPLIAGGYYAEDLSTKEIIEDSDSKRVKDYDLEAGIDFKNVVYLSDGESSQPNNDDDDNGSNLNGSDSDDSYTRSAPGNLPKFPIFWINPDNEALTKATSQYTYHAGNDVSVGYLYGEIALVIKVGPHKNRKLETAMSTE